MSKFPYIIPQPKVYKPAIPVILGFNKTHKITSSILALIDSGADVCFCHLDIAFWLGSNDHKLKEHREFTTANNGKFLAYKEKIILHVNGKNYGCPFYITSELPPSTPVILGQYGFFDHFQVNFNLKEKEIEII